MDRSKKNKWIYIGIGFVTMLALFIFVINICRNDAGESVVIPPASILSEQIQTVEKYDTAKEQSTKEQPTTKQPVEANTQMDEDFRPEIDPSKLTENTLESKYAAFLALPRSEINVVLLPAGWAYGTDEVNMKLEDLKLMGALTDDIDVSNCIKKFYSVVEQVEEKNNTNRLIMMSTTYHSSECGQAFKEYFSDLNLFSDTYLSDLSLYLATVSDAEKDNLDFALSNFRYPNIPFVNAPCNYKLDTGLYVCIKNEALSINNEKVVKLEIMTLSGFLTFYFHQENDDWVIYFSDFSHLGGNPGVTVPQFADKQP